MTGFTYTQPRPLTDFSICNFTSPSGTVSIYIVGDRMEGFHMWKHREYGNLHYDLDAGTLKTSVADCAIPEFSRPMTLGELDAFEAEIYEGIGEAQREGRLVLRQSLGTPIELESEEILAEILRRGLTKYCFAATYALETSGLSVN